MNAGSRVDDYISRLPDWQQAICQQVRHLVHDADPEVEKTIKRSVLPSSRTTAPAAGYASKHHPHKPEFSPRRLDEPLTEP